VKALPAKGLNEMTGKEDERIRNKNPFKMKG
jgi:hypothetical protein